MNKGIDAVALQKIIEKAKIYQGQEDLIFDDLERVFNNLKYEYYTDNSKNIDSIDSMLNQKFSDIMTIHKNNITVLNRNLDKYSDLELEVQNKFNNL